MSYMLPWVARSCTEEETERMYLAIGNASRNTMFSKWLQAVQRESPRAETAASAFASPKGDCPTALGATATFSWGGALDSGQMLDFSVAPAHGGLAGLDTGTQADTSCY